MPITVLEREDVSLAQKYLAAPCTTIPYERLLSSGGNIVTETNVAEFY